jgi:hypothetical protein
VHYYKINNSITNFIFTNSSKFLSLLYHRKDILE